jgi:hypothetical protein
LPVWRTLTLFLCALQAIYYAAQNTLLHHQLHLEAAEEAAAAADAAAARASAARAAAERAAKQETKPAKAKAAKAAKAALAPAAPPLKRPRKAKLSAAALADALAVALPAPAPAPAAHAPAPTGAGNPWLPSHIAELRRAVAENRGAPTAKQLGIAWSEIERRAPADYPLLMSHLRSAEAWRCLRKKWQRMGEA